MRFLSFSTSFIIAIISIIAYREAVFEFATFSLNSIINRYNNTNSNTPDSASSSSAVAAPTPNSPQQQQQPTFYNPTTPETANDNNKMSIPRTIRKIFLAAEQAEGAGARVRRSIGTPSLRHHTPFLMLDHFKVSSGAGFPDHCHRGMETITMLLQGAVDHEDFAGNKGTIEAGDLQFMTAGKGIVHAEMPSTKTAEGEPNVGLQLWVDLPENLKMCEPRYRDLKSAEIPVAEQQQEQGGEVRVRVISGRSLGVDSVRDLAYTPVWILDISLKKGGQLTQELPQGWNAFAYVLEGAAKFGDGAGPEKKKVEQYHNCVFGEEGDVVHVEGDEDARVFLIAGQPLDQKVVQYGPMVMTSPEEIRQAFMDYQFGQNGFERAKGWQSEIGKSMMG